MTSFSALRIQAARLDQREQAQSEGSDIYIDLLSTIKVLSYFRHPPSHPYDDCWFVVIFEYNAVLPHVSRFAFLCFLCIWPNAR